MIGDGKQLYWIIDVGRLLIREESIKIDGNPVGDESLQKQIPACPSYSPTHTPTQKIKAWTQTIKHTNLKKALVDAKVSMSRRQL